MSLATNAAYYRAVADLLSSWGWGPFINFWPGWEARSNAGVVMLPQAVTIHHTGGTATPTSYLVNPTDRPELKVLANIHLDQLERRIRFICAGGASHGGYTHEPCYKRVVGGTAPLDRDLVPGADSRTFSINKRTVGVEVDGAGGPNEWDAWTYRAAVAITAACQIVGRWPLGDAPRVGAHKEHTRRKPGDPFANMGRFRRDVAACIANPWRPVDVPAPLKLGDRLLSKKAGQDTGPDVAALAKLLTARGYNVGTPADVFGPRMDAAVRDLQTRAGLKVTGVVDAATLTELLAEPVPTPTEPGPVPVPEPKVVELRFATLNCLDPRFGGSTTDARARALAKVISSFDAPLVALTECPDDARSKNLRTRIRKHLPGGVARWKVLANGPTAILFDSQVAQLDPGKTRDDYFTDARYHGYRAGLFDLAGFLVAFGAYHLPPNTIASETAQKHDVREAAAAVQALGGLPVLAGDGLNDNGWLPGWTELRAGSNAATPTYKRAITDRVHTKPRPGQTVQVIGYGVRKTTATDHDGPVTKVRITTT